MLGIRNPYFKYSSMLGHLCAEPIHTYLAVFCPVEFFRIGHTIFGTTIGRAGLHETEHLVKARRKLAGMRAQSRYFLLPTLSNINSTIGIWRSHEIDFFDFMG